MPIDKPRNLQHAISVWGHDIDFEPLLIPEPTDARPGSIEKVRVMQARLEAGEDLHHWGDCRMAATHDTQRVLADFAIEHAAAQRDENREKNVKDNWEEARKKLKTNRIKPARKRA